MAHFGSNVSRNSAKKVSEASGVGYVKMPDGMKFFTPPDSGKVVLDILPYVVTDEHHIDKDTELGIATAGEQWYKRPYYVHRNIGARNETVVCPTTFGKKCPICEARSELLNRSKTDEDAKEQAKGLKPSLRNLYIVLPIGVKDYDEVPYIWDISQYVFQDHLDPEILEDDSRAIFPDLESGMSLRIRFAEASFAGNKYASVERIDFIERDQQYDPDYIQDMPSLDEMLTVLSYRDLEAKFLGTSEDDSEDEEDEGKEEPETASRKRRGVKLEEVRSLKEDLKEGEEKQPITRTASRRGSKKEEDAAVNFHEVTSKSSRKGATSRKPEKENECPCGYTFGDDCDLNDECANCEKWEECIRARRESKGRK